MAVRRRLCFCGCSTTLCDTAHSQLGCVPVGAAFMKMAQRSTQLQIIRAAGETYGQPIAKKRSKSVSQVHSVTLPTCTLASL